MKCYIVYRGRRVGIFDTWAEVEKSVLRFSGAKYKKFNSRKEAEKEFDRYSKALVNGGTSLAEQTMTKAQLKRYKKTKKKPKPYKPFVSNIKIYTDGSSYPNPGSIGVGVVICESNGKLIDLAYGGYLKKSTVNFAELNGILYALKEAEYFINENKSNKIEIFSDSMYSIRCVNQWPPYWKKNGWKKKDGGKIKNLGIIKECYAIYNRIKNNVRIRHVKSHSNNYHNDLADKLANEGRTQKEPKMVPFMIEDVHYLGV